MKNSFPIYWIYEGKKHTGYAQFHEASTGSNAFITFDPDLKDGNDGYAFEWLDAVQLPGGEDELRKVWEDLLSDAEASEDGCLDITYCELT